MGKAELIPGLTAAQNSLFTALAKQIDMTPAVGAPAADLSNDITAFRVTNDPPFTVERSIPKNIAPNLWQAVRDRIDAVQTEHPIRCFSLGGDGWCSAPVFPGIPWLKVFEATLNIPATQLDSDQRAIQMQGYRELLVRQFEYGTGTEVIFLFRKFLAFDREAAVTFVENLRGYGFPDIANALLEDYRQHTQWDDLKGREGKLLLEYLEEAMTCWQFCRSALHDFDYEGIQEGLLDSIHPNLKINVERCVSAVVDYYEAEYRYEDDKRESLIQKIEAWRDRVLANLK